ncbi:MAG: ATP-dependent helicase [Verrucomicrobiales bacterium]
MTVISVRLTGLNPSQLEGVKATEGPVLILAGAGSGKTRVITTRIAYLLAQGVAPDRLLAVTFTNKAANEMRERVGQMVPPTLSKALTISTFHALCVRLLRSGIERLGYKANFAIYTASDQVGLLRQIIVRKGGRDEKLDPQAVLSLISRWKNKGIAVESGGDDLAAEVAREYQRQLKLRNACDFDDLLGLATRLLHEHAEVRSQWQARFHYLMVDEFQDTNRQQMELLCLLAGERKNVCVVGDDDQSIYGWRGADITNITGFERHFPSPTVIKLMENYRSQRPILDTANAVIRHNKGRREKRLIATKPGTEPVRLIAMPGDHEEAEFVVNEIWTANTVQRRPWDDFAVLFRANAQSRLFEEALRKQGIPYRLLGGQSFFERREVKDLLSYLHVALQPHDDVHLLRIVSNPPRGLGDTTIELATEDSIAQRRPIFESLADTAFSRQFSTKTQNALARFTSQVRTWQDALNRPGARYAELADHLVRETGYLEHLRRSCRSPEEELNRTSNVGEFLQSIHQHQQSSGRHGLRGFLDSVALDDDFQRESETDKASKKPGVWLITLHASKGLEFPQVYLVGLEDGLLPHKRSLEENTLDEERRLLYVGITRAQEKLTMTYCRQRLKWGQPLGVTPSRFIKELPSPPVQRIDHAQIMKQPVSIDVAKAHFAALKAKLGM